MPPDHTEFHTTSSSQDAKNTSQYHKAKPFTEYILNFNMLYRLMRNCDINLTTFQVFSIPIPKKPHFLRIKNNRIPRSIRYVQYFRHMIHSPPPRTACRTRVGSRATSARTEPKASFRPLSLISRQSVHYQRKQVNPPGKHKCRQ